MIKALARGPDGTVLIAGLSEENILRLKADRPVAIPLSSFGVGNFVRSDTKLVICYGRTEAELEAYMRRNGVFNEHTRIEGDSKLDAHIALKESEAKVLILTVGLPRSGKSTWARSQSYPIVCPDEIRTALHGQRFAAEAEPMVWAICKVMVRALFGAGHQFVILDACNTTRKRRDEWKSSEWATRYRCFFESVDTCVGRALAADDHALIPIIERMAGQLEPCGDDEEPFQ